MEFQTKFQDCYAILSGDCLTIGNDRIERSWSFSGKLPQVRTLLNKKTGRQWLAPETRGQWNDWPEDMAAFFKQGITVGPMTVNDIRAGEDDDLGIGEAALKVTVCLSFGENKVDWVHIVYPGRPVMRSFLQVTGKMTGAQAERLPEWMDDYSDYLPLDTMHMGWKSAAFTDITDDNDNLVVETKGLFTRRESRVFQGNLLTAMEKTSTDGLTLVKEGPSTVAYLTKEKADFVAKGTDLFSVNWGFEPELPEEGETMASYPTAVVLWDGGEEGALEALQAYNRAVRKFEPWRDAQIMSNTWGDGNCDGRLNEQFLMRELRRAAEIGISYFQIDDGWQTGTTANSVNAAAQGITTWGSGIYKANPDFWTVNKTRLPNGLEPLVEFARAHNIVLGLWFSPDGENDYENWKRDADTLLGLHRKYGITAFKMDGLTFHNKRGEENFGRLMRRVVEGSQGKVFFNLDTTASARNGYFGRVQYGSLFLENRFTNIFGKWPNYWPHRTLRNLWMLSRYMPAERLQIEFLNVKRNVKEYENDILSPVNWGQEMAFAISMFASPLAWLELSVLDEEQSGQLKRAIAAYRPVQEEILKGHILPIGEEPDGFAWTGLQSKGANGNGYLVIFREKNGERAHKFSLWGRQGRALHLEPILGAGEAQTVPVKEDGTVTLTLQNELSFALYQYRWEN